MIFINNTNNESHKGQLRLIRITRTGQKKSVPLVSVLTLTQQPISITRRSRKKMISRVFS